MALVAAPERAIFSVGRASANVTQRRVSGPALLVTIAISRTMVPHANGSAVAS